MNNSNPTPESNTPSSPPSSNLLPLWIILGVFLVILIGGLIYIFSRNSNSDKDSIFRRKDGYYEFNNDNLI